MSEEDTPMTGELGPAEEQELSAEELAVHQGQALPEREAMSSINLNLSGVENFAMPINEASALNYNSSYSVAAADADQTVILGQAAQTGPEAAAVESQPAEAAPQAAETSPPVTDIEAQPQTSPVAAEPDAQPAQTTPATETDGQPAQAADSEPEASDGGGESAAGDSSDSE